MDLNLLILFKKIADFGSFTKTALDQGMPKSAVSQKLAKLEEDIGARLFHRSTRRIALTEVGETVYRHAAQILEQRDALIDSVAATNDEPTGLIRMTAPPDIGAHLIRTVIRRLTTDHPSLRVELDLSTRYVDLINEGFDLAVRASDKGLQDSNLVATKLRQTKIHVYGTREFINAGAPLKEPSQLMEHPFISFAPIPGAKANKTRLVQSSGTVNSLEIIPTLMTSNFQGVFEAIRAGIGIGLLPDEICHNEVQSGEFVKVLPEWTGGEASFYAVFPSKKFLTARVKLMLQYLVSAW